MRAIASGPSVLWSSDAAGGQASPTAQPFLKGVLQGSVGQDASRQE
jgi:hypothetical protein